MFAVGSFVVYRAEGVCRISDIKAESFGVIGSKENYYILTPLNDEKSTVFVPVANETLVGMMRPLLSAEEITALATELRDCRMEWISDGRARNLRFREILGLGDRKELIVLANTVWEHMEEAMAHKKKPNATDEKALRRAKKLLFDEFSATTDLQSEDDLIPLLRGELCVSNKR
ncbi:MAG: CarD family transcriptional regulator [Clostridia bacterium]|nr:CarD family transcriptional regulator [Clostridia bacterium]